MGQIITIDFRGDELFGFRRDDGEFVALRPMVEAMGMDWSAQFRRVKRDPILAEGVAMMATPTGQEAVCLRLDLINGWLFGIDSTRVTNEATRAKVQAYQREGYRVLAQAFGAIRAPNTNEVAFGTACNLVTEARRSYGKAAARELWPRLGLPMTPAMVTVLTAMTATPHHKQGTLFPVEGGR